MQSYDFIFSNALRFRLSRHLLMWFCWWAIQSLIYSYVRLVATAGFIVRWKIAAVDAFFYLLPHIFLAYALMYLVIPKLLLRGRYLFSFIGVLLLFLLTGAISGFMATRLLPGFRSFWLGPIPDTTTTHILFSLASWQDCAAP